MPEKNSLSRMEKAYTLADADRNNQLICIRCCLCRITRNYLPKDLIQRVGIVPVHLLPTRFRCEECKRREHLKVSSDSYSGSDLGKMPVRHLVRISYVRDVTWDDGVL